MRKNTSVQFIVRLVTVSLVLSGFIFDLAPQSASAATQNAYRWRNDDGSETTATWSANENTAITDVEKDALHRLRIGMNSDSNNTAVQRQKTFIVGEANDQENDVETGVIDATGTYGYFPTVAYRGSGVVNISVTKVRLSDMTEVGDLDISGLSEEARASAIDTVNNFAYFVTYSSTLRTKIYKIDLSDFTLEATLTLEGGDINIISAAINTTHGYLYLGTQTNPAKVVKVKLADFTRVGTVIFESGENNAFSMVLDPGAGYGYVGVYDSGVISGKIVKFNLGTGDALPSRVGALSLTSLSELQPRAAAIDTNNGYAYFSVFSNAGSDRVVKIKLSDFSRLGSTAANFDEEEFYAAAIDVDDGAVYFVGSVGAPAGGLVKFNLGVGDALPTRESVAPFSRYEQKPRTALVDTANGYVYCGTDTEPARVIKVQLSSMTVTDSLIMESDGNYATSAAIDPAGGFAYFGSYNVPGKIVKLRLSDDVHVSTLTLTDAEGALYLADIDTVNGYAYFFSQAAATNYMLKIKLSTFTVVSSLAMTDVIRTVSIEPNLGYAYLGTNDTPGKVIRVSLGVGDAAPAIVDSITFSPGEGFVYSAVIDTTNDYAYFGTYNSPGKIVKINLATFSRVSDLTLNSWEINLRSAVIDVAAGYAYFGTAVSRI